MATALEVLLRESAATRTPCDWKHWQQQDAVGLAYAALLTLGIQPHPRLEDGASQAAIDILGAVVAKEYRRRSHILRSRYGAHPYLPQETRVGEEKPIVRLQNLLSFGRVVGWDGLHGLDTAVNGRPTDGPTINSSEITKGEAYALARLGGLLKLIEEWAILGRIPKSDELLKGNTNLNFSQLGRRVEAKILEIKNSQTPETGLQATTISREYGNALKHLQPAQLR